MTLGIHRYLEINYSHRSSYSTRFSILDYTLEKFVQSLKETYEIKSLMSRLCHNTLGVSSLRYSTIGAPECEILYTKDVDVFIATDAVPCVTFMEMLEKAFIKPNKTLQHSKHTCHSWLTSKFSVTSQ